MQEQPLIGELAIVGGVGVIAALILARLRMPATIGFLVAGAVAGPHGLGLISDVEDIELIAEVGVILLLFGIGLEFSFSRLRVMWRALVLGGSVQVGVTILATLGVLLSLGDSPERALTFGFVVALSSTAIVLRTLTDQGEVESPHGRLVIAALIFQDLLVVPMMLLVPVLAGSGEDNVAMEVVLALTKATVVVAATLAVARLAIPSLFSLVDAVHSREVFLLAVLSVGLGLAWGMSTLGLSFALGAFLAGMLLADTDYSHRAVTEVIPLRDAFTSVFFVSLGMLFDGRVILDHPVTAALVLLGLLPGKGVIAALAALVMRQPARVAWRAGVYLAQFGEFGFVLLGIAAAEGLVTAEEGSIIVTAGVVSMLVSRMLMSSAERSRLGEALLQPLATLFRARDVDDTDIEDAELSGHVVVVGYGVAGRLLVAALAQARVPHVVLELDAQRVRDARTEANVPIYYGDVTHAETLDRARVNEARSLVLLINDPAAVRRAISAVHQACPHVPILVRTRYVADRRELLRLGAARVVSEELEGGTEMAAHVLAQLGLTQEDIRDFIGEALVAGGHHDATSRSDAWVSALDERRYSRPEYGL